MSSVYDAPYIFENGKMEMQTDIDMRHHEINVLMPTEDDHPVNLHFLKSLKQYFLVSAY